MSWLWGKTEAPKVDVNKQARQLKTVDQIHERMEELATQQIQDQAKLDDLNEYIDSHKRQWLQQGDRGRQLLGTYIQKRNTLQNTIQNKEDKIVSLERIHGATQEAASNMAVTQSMQDAIGVIDEIKQDFSPEQIDRMYMQADQSILDVEDMSRIHSRPLGVRSHRKNKKAIDAEIAALEAEMANELPQAPSIVNNNNNREPQQQRMGNKERE